LEIAKKTSPKNLRIDATHYGSVDLGSQRKVYSYMNLIFKFDSYVSPSRGTN
jgi:hypothetical protein